MSRGTTTALLAALFYGVLLFWAVSWQKPSDHEIASSGDKTTPAPAATPTVEPAAPDTPQTSPAEPEVATEPARFAAEQDADGRWEIDGQLASQSEADAIRAALGSSGAEIIGEIAVSPETDAAPWATALATWIPQSLAQTVGIAVIDGQLLLAGAVASAEEQAAVVTAAESHFADLALTIESEFEIIAPTEEPEIALAPDGNGGLVVAGSLREADLKTRLVELLGQVSDDAAITDEIEVSNAIAPAAWGPSLLQSIPALVTEVTDLQLMASGGVFLIAGSVSSTTTKTALAEMTTQAFEGVAISIDDQLTIAALDEVASISISRGDDGVLQLAGLLADQSTADDLLAAAKAQVVEGAAEPMSSIEVRGGVAPAPWAETMMGLVPAFAASVGWGALSVHGDQVALEAQVSQPEDADVLEALVNNAFPDPHFKRVIALSVAAPQSPSDEDIATLERMIADTVIYFGNASAKVDDDDLPKLEELAAALDAVPGSGIALLGHADPKGNAAYNRKLSRQRCDAVRAVLESFGIDSLLIETEEKGETSGSTKRYESGRRVEFELR